MPTCLKKLTLSVVIIFASFVFVLPALAIPVIVFAAEGSLVELGNLNNSLKITTAKDINNNGAVVGESAVAEQETRAFLWQNGVLTNLGSLGGNSSAAAINDNGQVVGYSNNATTNEDLPNATVIMQAVMWENNKIKGLGFLAGGNYSQATDINNNGQAVGYSNLYSNIKEGGLNNYHAFIWQGGVMKDLGALGGENSKAMAINNNGYVVGCANTAGGAWRAFLWFNNKMTDLNNSPGASSCAVKINNNNQIIGWEETTNSAGFIARRHWLWQNNKLEYLNEVPANSDLVDINDKGIIVGKSYLWQNNKITYFNDIYLNQVINKKTNPNKWLSSARAINNNNEIVGAMSQVGVSKINNPAAKMVLADSDLDINLNTPANTGVVYSAEEAKKLDENISPNATRPTLAPSQSLEPTSVGPPPVFPGLPFVNSAPPTVLPQASVPSFNSNSIKTPTPVNLFKPANQNVLEPVKKPANITSSIKKNTATRTNKVALVKTKTSARVYAVINGKREIIKTPKDFAAAGYNWKNIKTITDLQMKNIPLASAAPVLKK